MKISVIEKEQLYYPDILYPSNRSYRNTLIQYTNKPEYQG